MRYNMPETQPRVQAVSVLSPLVVTEFVGKEANSSVNMSIEVKPEEPLQSVLRTSQVLNITKETLSKIRQRVPNRAANMSMLVTHSQAEEAVADQLK
jgi:hypothetical protein